MAGTSKSGRKPKPTALKKLEGNPGKRPLNKNEPKPRPIAPPCPRWLPSEGKKLWRKLAPILARMGVLTEADGLALEMLCYNYARFRRCAGKLEDTPEGFTADTYTCHNGDRKPSPYVGMCKTAMAEIRSLLGEFGLTPSSRTRLTLPELAEVDEFEELLNRGKDKRPSNHLRAVDSGGKETGV